MDTALLTPLTSLETSLAALVSSLTTSSTYAAAPAASQSLLSADDALTSALLTLQTHQQNYARILRLRAEAEQLQNQIKDIVRTCADLRNEIGAINPTILDGSDDEDEDEDEEDEPGTRTDARLPQAAAAKAGVNKAKEVDYQTLLNFAARIGKHNTLAAQAAEEESTRRIVEARNNGVSNDADQVNGNKNSNTQEITTSNANATQESTAEVQRMTDAITLQRAHQGMAFPASESLRRGMLGYLTKLREDEGDVATEAEVERLVRATENISSSPHTTSDVAGNQAGQEVGKVIEETKVAASAEPGPSRQRQRAPSIQQRPVSAPKRKLDLDFPGSGDDDDSDDDND